MARSNTDISNTIHSAKVNKHTYLDLSNEGLLEIPQEVFDLVHLGSINLSGNELKTVPVRLWDLPKLKWVTLLGNPLEALPDRPGLQIDAPTLRRCLGQCDTKNLHVIFRADETMAAAEFLIQELRQGLSLAGLTLGHWVLMLGDNHPAPNKAMQKVLDSLAGFQGLTALSLRGMRLGSVPAGISQLRQLKTLALNSLGLKKLPAWIGKLDLEAFSALDNRLTGLPASFRGLGALKSLQLGWNPLGHIPAVIFDLVSLESLHIGDCQIREIPADILRLSQLKNFEFSSEVLESPPPEVANKGLDAIRDYWHQRTDAGVDYLCEAKLIILGEPGAGKTSLAQKLKNPAYKLLPHEPSTEGIEVMHYQFPTAIRIQEQGLDKLLQRDFQASIWDFGGQEIYHATHQFFLTKRSLYVLVCDDRKEDTDFAYWLRIVELLSDGSPILIVQNEKQDRSRDIGLSSLRAQFGSLKEALATNLDTNRGLDAVIRAVQRELQQLPHIGTGLPATWKRVRLALEQDLRDHISLEEYLALCESPGFTSREYKLQLSGYLHDLGICLHFQDDPLLKHLVVLKPSWGTDAVYRVLDDTAVKQSWGHFTKTQLRSIWSEPKYAGMHDELLRLMMKFQLCYELETGGTYIAPQLLSSTPPAYPWDTAGGLVVRYEYAFMPKGILSRFIVAMHRLIEDRGRRVWRTGVVLEKDGARAEVIEDYSQRRIRVRISGPYPQGLLAVVDDHLERLHAAFPRLKYERYLPCPCAECRVKAEPYSFPLKNLIKWADKNKPIQCYESGDMVDAAQLLREVLPSALRYSITDLGNPFEEAPPLPAPAAPSPEVFVSYAWTDDSTAIVDRLQQAFEKTGTRLHRDREDVRYKDSIRDFMRRIGQGSCVVVIISEKYLKSDNCMFELTEVAKAQNLRARIFPIVLADANIYKPIGRARYIKYWEAQEQELGAELKTLRGDNLTTLQEELNTYAEIRRLFDGIAGTLRDMNALTPAMHSDSDFDDLIRRVRAQLES